MPFKVNNKTMMFIGLGSIIFAGIMILITALWEDPNPFRIGSADTFPYLLWSLMDKAVTLFTFLGVTTLTAALVMEALHPTPRAPKPQVMPPGYGQPQPYQQQQYQAPVQQQPGYDQQQQTPPSYPTAPGWGGQA